MKEYPYWWDTVPAVGIDDRRSTIDDCRTADDRPIVNHQSSIINHKWDVAIVGAGYTGLAAARYLARAGASVVVFERERANSLEVSAEILQGDPRDLTELLDRRGRHDPVPGDLVKRGAGRGEDPLR